MDPKKLLRLALVLVMAVGWLIPSFGPQPPRLNDCTTPSQPHCGG
jgi:hypothetical protein